MNKSSFFKVLIVAKCIVNFLASLCLFVIPNSINSSKVYCKLNKIKFKDRAYNVLIVAKCIVNEEGKILTAEEIQY